MMRRWGTSAVMAAGAVVVGTVSIPLAAVFLVAAVVFSPLMFPRPVTDAEARERGLPIIYWRPGCQYWLRLRIRLGLSGRRFTWVDIWRDPAGAATVREVTGGDETVPTVVVAGVGHVNPDPRWVRSLVA
jgi:mycoredoxin